MELLWNVYCACVVTAPINTSSRCTKRMRDLLEDVIIENKQAIEMVEMYSNILMNMMNAFTSIISNNLNMVMKMLAYLTITLAVPTIIFSLWGTNVPLPFQDDPEWILRGKVHFRGVFHHCYHRHVEKRFILAYMTNN